MAKVTAMAMALATAIEISMARAMAMATAIATALAQERWESLLCPISAIQGSCQRSCMGKFLIFYQKCFVMWEGKG
jgi:hypothetical protein